MTRTHTNKAAPSALRAFLGSEALGGVLLIAAAAAALAVANSPLAPLYGFALDAPTGPVLTPKLGPMTPRLWINDGLMTLFFLLVGLEIKREFIDGRLATWSRRRLPFIAACAGMVVPAIVFLIVAGGDTALRRGWAVPAATDIAFALGVLALLGSRAPAGLKLFLTTVAIVDDMGAVAIIALAYSHGLNLSALAAAAAIWGTMFALNRRGVRALSAYVLLALALWFAVLQSGVHATVAGVLAALAIPLRRTPGAPDAADSPLHRLEHGLHPWVAYLIVPAFGFANAGLPIEGGLGQFAAPLPLAIALGLIIGKPVGVFGSIWIAVRLKIARPLRASWTQVFGLSLLCGVGFTMSLFIGGLAFTDPSLSAQVKAGVLAGSLLSALAGYAVLRFASKGRAVTIKAGVPTDA